jgi:hypothetical protein
MEKEMRVDLFMTQIHLDVTGMKIWSKIDFLDAYNQVWTVPKDVYKNAFAMIYNTYVSHIMQIGNCNAPAMFQHIMTMIFWDYIGIFMHAYLDDLFIYSKMLEEHEHNLELVSSKLREHKFYLKEDKCELYAKVIDCLGHKINNHGLHTDADKMAKIRDWW